MSLHADYPYGGYDPSFDGQQPFTDYGYPAETGWSAVEQGMGTLGRKEGRHRAIDTKHFSEKAFPKFVDVCR